MHFWAFCFGFILGWVVLFCLPAWQISCLFFFFFFPLPLCPQWEGRTCCFFLNPTDPHSPHPPLPPSLPLPSDEIIIATSPPHPHPHPAGCLTSPFPSLFILTILTTFYLTSPISNPIQLLPVWFLGGSAPHTHTTFPHPLSLVCLLTHLDKMTRTGRMTVGDGTGGKVHGSTHASHMPLHTHTPLCLECLFQEGGTGSFLHLPAQSSIWLNIHTMFSFTMHHTSPSPSKLVTFNFSF